ncbi:WD-40 repeat protein [[Actinomadura] parvosata subsp. kistnae]|nr:WD-40 repeat protein [Actinomadura parvosata subsp. kistnae]
MILLVSLAGGVAALVAARNAAVDRDRSLSRELAAQSISAGSTDTRLSQALAVKAWHTAPTAEAGQSVQNALTNPLRTVLTGHEGEVQGLLVSADGRTVVATTEDDFKKQQVWLWREDAPGQPRRVAEDPRESADLSALMSADGRTVVISSIVDEDLDRPSVPQVWRDTTPSASKPLTDCPGSFGLALSADGQVLVAGVQRAGRIRELWLCRTTSSGPPRKLTGYRDLAGEVHLSSDGGTIAVTTSQDKDYTAQVWIWSADEPDHPRPLIPGHVSVNALAMSTDGNTIVTVTVAPGHDAKDSNDDEQTIRIWEGAERRPQLLGTSVSSWGLVTMSDDGATVADANSLRVWTTATPDEPITLHQPSVQNGGFDSVQVAGTTFLGVTEGQAWIWDLTRPRLLPRRLPDGQERAGYLMMSRDGRTLAGALDDGRIALWSLAALSYTGRVLTSPAQLSSLVVSDDGSAMAASAAGRAWVWRHGESPSPRELTGHRGLIVSVALSADGMTVIAATTSARVPRSTLWSWSAAAPSAARQLTDLAGTVLRIAASADGKAVACLVQRQQWWMSELRVWRDGRTTVNLRVSGALGSSRLYISADGAIVAALAADTSGNELGDAFLAWEVEEPRKPRRVRGPVDVTRPRFPMTADGRVLTWDADDQAILLRPVAGTRPPVRLTGHQGRVDQLDVSADGRTAVATTDNGAHTWLWNTADPGRPRRLTGQAGHVRMLRLSAGGRGVEAVTTAEESDRQVWHWDVAAPDRPRALTGHQGPIGLIDVSTGGDTVISAGVAANTGSEDRAVWLWRTSDPGRPARLFGGYYGIIGNLELTSDGRFAVGRGQEGTVWRWDVTSPSEPSRPLTGHRLPIGDIAMSANGRLLAGADVKGTVWAWDATSLSTPGRALRGGAPIAGVAVSADGRTLVGHDAHGVVWAWDAHRLDRPAAELVRAPDKIRDLALGGDGKVLAAATYSSGVLVWDLDRGGPPRSFTGLKGAIRRVALSADGLTLVGGGSGGEVWTWDLRASDQLGHLLAGHRSEVYGVALSADGSTIASIDSEGYARVWSAAAQGQAGPQLGGLATEASDIALDGRGRTLLALDSSGNVQVWQWAAPPAPAPACERLAARLHGTPEWGRHLGGLSVREACRL